MVCKTIYGGSNPPHHSNALGGSNILSVLVVARQRGVKEGRPEAPSFPSQFIYEKRLDSIFKITYTIIK
jgi:hypothetical protein